MKLRVLTVLLAAPLAVGAQEVVTLDQSLSLSYFGSRASLGGLSSSSAYTKTDYRFDLGMPILAYRLGALDLGGSIGYARQTFDAQSDSATGLNTLSLSGALFPYQPYHFTFEVTRSTAPSLFGSGSNTSQTLGLDFLYRGRTLQDFRVAYRHGSLDSEGQNGAFNSWVVTENERRGRTDIRFYGDHQEATFGEGPAWKSSSMTTTARTSLAGDWTWNNNVSAFDYQGSRLVQAGSSLLGTAGPWTSTTFLDLTYAGTSSSSDRSGGLSQSLARSWNRISAFGVAGVSTGSSSGTGTSSSMETLILGASYRLTPEWTVMGDLSGAWGLNPSSNTGQSSSSGPTHSAHVGLTWGGAISDTLRHAFFYWSDLRFQKRIEEDYPPDYLPPELAKTQMRRRMNQQGALQFSADAYRVENGGPGRQEWYRVQGGLSFTNGLMVQTIGDLRTDDRMSNRDLVFRNEHLMVYGAYQLGQASLRFNYGYSKATVRDANATPLTPESQSIVSSASDRSATYYGLGVNAMAYGVPYGVMVLRNNDSTGVGTTSLLTYMSTGFRKVRFNLNYQRGWRTDGLRTSQVSIQLARWFDTIPVWGLGD